jgi:peroxiredoxin (alkyl hydroperoxide reductase subunit C)
MAWTFVCPTEILAFSDRAEEFKKRGASVVFASTDSEYSLLAWTSASKKDGGLGNVNIPLYADKNHSLSKDYGVLIEEEGIALRGLFLIDPNGVVRQVGPKSRLELFLAVALGLFSAVRRANDLWLRSRTCSVSRNSTC